MKRLLFSLILFLSCVSLIAQQDHVMNFANGKSRSGAMFSLESINPCVPDDWTVYTYLTLEYKTSTTQNIMVELKTPTGTGQAILNSYIPKAWNRIAIPLKCFTGYASTVARFMGYCGSGATHCKLNEIDSIGFYMTNAKGNQTLELLNIYLSKTDPDDRYMESTPYIDEFGQNTFLSYSGKVSSLEALKQQWDEEDATPIDSTVFNYSKYGGYKQKRVNGTGFFRTQKIDGRWWLVDPEGYVFLTTGCCCENINNGGEIFYAEHRQTLYKELPSQDVINKVTNASKLWGGTANSFGLWNVYRRYGDSFETKAVDNLLNRMARWGLNTIGMWSTANVIKPHRKAFQRRFTDSGRLIESSLMGLPDVYASDYESKIDSYVKSEVTPY